MEQISAGPSDRQTEPTNRRNVRSIDGKTLQKQGAHCPTDRREAGPIDQAPRSTTSCPLPVGARRIREWYLTCVRMALMAPADGYHVFSEEEPTSRQHAVCQRASKSAAERAVCRLELGRMVSAVGRLVGRSVDRSSGVRRSVGRSVAGGRAGGRASGLIG